MLDARPCQESEIRPEVHRQRGIYTDLDLHGQPFRFRTAGRAAKRSNDAGKKSREPMPTRTELEFVIEPQVRKFCGPIYFTRSLDEAEGNVTANGSFGLVDTGTKKLLVTCYHVWDEFQKERLERPELKMCLCLDQGPAALFESPEPLGEDPEFDLATFDMQPLLAACGSRKFYQLNQNPPGRVREGDAVFFIGFPGNLRRVIGGELRFGRVPFGVKVCSVDGWHIQSEISKLKMKPDEFGGISGCPAFVVRPGKPIQLVGFATSVVLAEYLCFTHATCLNQDGTITKK
jgi:hypothetical protein